MFKLKTLGFWITLLVVLMAFMAFQPVTVRALPEGITETPSSTPEQPTVAPSETPVPPSPTPSPTPEIPAPVPSPTWTPQTPPQEPPVQEKQATTVPLLPVTGEIPPDGPFGGPLSWVVLLAGVLIGLALGLGGRKLLFAHSGKWLARFLSSRR